MKQAKEYNKCLERIQTSSETEGSGKKLRQKRVIIGLIIFIIGLVFFMSVTVSESLEDLFKNILIGFWVLAFALWFAGGWGVLSALNRIKPQYWWEALFVIAWLVLPFLSWIPIAIYYRHEQEMKWPMMALIIGGITVTFTLIVAIVKGPLF